MRKLLNKKGESLVESLVAILIFTMASIILYSMVTTASKINMEAKENDKNIASQLAVAEHAEIPVGDGKVIISIKDIASGTAEKISETNVKVYRDNSKDGTLYSYFAAP